MIGVLLLVQWLTSAYACPQGRPQPPGWGDEVAIVAAPMSDCHGMMASTMDPANPALCKAHCDADKQAPMAKAPGDVPSPLLVWFNVAGPLLHDVVSAPAHARCEVRCAAPPGWPPLYLIHQVLRN